MSTRREIARPTVAGQVPPLALPHRGRPRKFARPSHPVTLTLPDDVIGALQAIDADLSRAVVRLAQPHLGSRRHPPAEVAMFGRRGVIVVNSTRTLEQRTGIVLVPLPDGRALISFDGAMTIERLELEVRDALADDALPAGDAEIFRTIADLLGRARRTKGVSMRQPHIIVIESVKGRKARGPRGG